MKKIRYALVTFAVMLLAAGFFVPQFVQEASADEVTPEQVFQKDYLTNGIAVMDDGTICAAGGQSITGYNQAGEQVFYYSLPAKCGNVCAYGEYVFAAGYMSGHTNEIYVLKPGDWTSCKLLYTGQKAQAVTIDYDGNLYCVNGSGTIKCAKISDVVSLSNKAEIVWTKTYEPNYPAIASDGKRYTQGIAVDGRGNIYIADRGTPNLSDGAVDGIYKYNPASGSVTPMYFSAGSSHLLLNRIYDICADDYGTVAVIGRYKAQVAIFCPGSTSADMIIDGAGFLEGVGRDKAGNIYYNATNGGSSQTDPRFGIYRINLNNVAVTGISLSAASQTIDAGKSFTLNPTVTPSDATNKDVMYSSSNSAVASVDASGKVTGKAEGKATITAKTVQGGKTATCEVTVNKAVTPTTTNTNPPTIKANPLTIKAKTATIKYKILKKKTQKLAITKVITFTKKGQGTMSYKKASGNKKITINKTTGKVTVKKGLKKGTYKVKIKVKAAGNASYKASAWKTVTFKIKVK